MIPKISRTTVQHKTWDSNFFGFPVGDLYALCDKPFLSQELLKYKNEGYRLLYWKIEDQDTTSLNIAQDLQFKTYDTKVTFVLNKKEIKSIISGNLKVNKYSGEITPELLTLGIESGNFSRFKKDKNFPPGTFEKMYTDWIYHAFSAENADVIFILEDNSKMVGFATLFLNEEDAEIVLITLDKNYRNMGYGKMFVNEIATQVFNNGFKRIYVVTQEQNAAANKLYKSCGFEIIKKEYIYHIWL